MWHFTPQLHQSNLKFDFEPAINEIDKNEEIKHQQFIDNLPTEEKNKFQKTVCKNWIYNRCDKGDHCKFLHEFDRDKMEKCQFWEKHHKCSNFDCIFRHDPIENVENKCLYYSSGFCKHGRKCRRPHIYKTMICLNYLAGFCPDGPKCPFSHPKWVDFGDLSCSQNEENINEKLSSEEKEALDKDIAYNADLILKE